MSNEMRLLEALCNALGFDVIANYDYQEAEVTPEKWEYILNSRLFVNPKREFVQSFDQFGAGRYFVNENGNRVSRLIDPIVTYELKKKGEK